MRTNFNTAASGTAKHRDIRTAPHERLMRVYALRFALLLAVCIAPSFVAPLALGQKADWPRFRGIDGSGATNLTDLPETWNVEKGENIAWKTPLTLEGNSSPIVVGGRVFITAADASHRMVQCFDAAGGKLLWQHDVPGGPDSGKPVKMTPDTGYAAPTMAGAGRHVAAIFANGDLAAYDLDGKLAWSVSLGIPDNAYGHAASLAVYNNLLITPFDQSTAKAARSQLTAFDMATGQKVWQQPRAVSSSWSTPCIAHTNQGDQLIATASPWVTAYEPLTGKELWKAKCLNGDVAPSPVYGGGLVLAPANDYSPLVALRCDGHGDVSATHIAWKCDENCPDICSPLATDAYLFLLTSAGVLTSYDLKKGEKLWEDDLGIDKCNSSVSQIGKRLLVVGETGKCVIVEPGEKNCKHIALNDLGEECITSPAFVDGRIIIRGKKNLICIGKP